MSKSERIRELYHAGHKVRVIAGMVGLVKGTVDKWLTRLGIANRNGRERRLNTTRRLLACGFARKRIAAKIGVCPQYASRLIAEAKRNPMPTCQHCRKITAAPKRGLCWACRQDPERLAAQPLNYKQRPDLDPDPDRAGEMATAAELDRMIAAQLPTMPSEPGHGLYGVPKVELRAVPRDTARGTHGIDHRYEQSPHREKCPLIPLLLADVRITPAMMDADKWLRGQECVDGIVAKSKDGSVVELRRRGKVLMRFDRICILRSGKFTNPTPTPQQIAASKFINRVERGKAVVTA